MPNNQRGFTPIYLLVGLVALMLMGGAYYFGKNSSSISPKNIPTVPTTTQSPTLTPTQKLTSIPTPTDKSDEVSTWQTFSSISLGFSAKYPGQVKITPQQDGSVHMSIWGPTQKNKQNFMMA
ncbi:MAG: hypothetical protein WCV81_00625 [Microgenomates group bacterium]|jgi:hypothetical protein